jgi:hypothetical protein
MMFALLNADAATSTTAVLATTIRRCVALPVHTVSGGCALARKHFSTSTAMIVSLLVAFASSALASVLARSSQTREFHSRMKQILQT